MGPDPDPDPEAEAAETPLRWLRRGSAAAQAGAGAPPALRFRVLKEIRQLGVRRVQPRVLEVDVAASSVRNLSPEGRLRKVFHVNQVKHLLRVQGRTDALDLKVTGARHWYRIHFLDAARRKVAFTGIHHTAVIVDDLERSLAFYHGVLGMEVSRNPARPDRNLPFRGAFLKIGHESMHLMELDNPDPLDPAVRPDHGGRDRHFCVGVESVANVIAELEKAGVPYTASKSGRAAVFFRDPDMNTMECLELKAVDGVAPWRA